MTTTTAAQIARTASDWTRSAGEKVNVEQIGSGLYGFTSESGSLRLLKQYRTVAKADCGFSVNLNSHYFVLEIAG